MHFLIRHCLRSSYCNLQTRQVLKQFNESMQLYVNLKVSRCLCSTVADSRVKSMISNLNVRKYLDFLTNEYMTGNTKYKLNSNLNLSALSYLFNERLEMIENIKNLKNLDKEDKELQKLVEEEECMYTNRLEEIDEMLLKEILHNIDLSSCNSIILDITAGVGGQEAMLFVKDLYNMYRGYANYLGFSFDSIKMDKSDNGGYRSISVIIRGNMAFQKFKYEGGVHRVQRVPATERSGRIHTSTVSVAVLPEPSEVDICIQPKDIKIETKKASGAGGQHVNTTDSAVRIIHLPTGTVAESQAERSQIKNKETAFIKLRVLLYEQELNKQLEHCSELRKKQMGLGMRNEKIRTYNYPQDRLTDHRLENGSQHNLKQFLEGGEMLEMLGERLSKNMQEKLLLENIRELKFK